jgi:CheW-like protein
VVDYVVGSHRTLIKNLGTFYSDLEGISGATILGDGPVALILDAPRLVREAARGCKSCRRGKGMTSSPEESGIQFPSSRHTQVRNAFSVDSGSVSGDGKTHIFWLRRMNVPQIGQRPVTLTG